MKNNKQEKDIALENYNLIKLEKILNLWKTKTIGTNRRFGPNSSDSKNSDTTSKKIMNREKTSGMIFTGRKASRQFRKDVEPNSLEDITLTSQRLCELYIEARLARSGMKGFNDRIDDCENEYSNVLQNMGQVLEMKYPRLYTKMSAHLRLNYNSEIVVWDSFNKFGSHLFSGGITWARIIALYAFTGGLALDCMTHGKKQLPERMVYWFGVFFSKRLASWIQAEGGWESLVDHFNSDKPSNLPKYDTAHDDDDVNKIKTIQDIMKRSRQFLEVNRLCIILVAVIVFLLIVLYTVYM